MGILTRGGFRRRLILLAAALALAIASVIILPTGQSRAAEVVEEGAGVLLLGVDSEGQSAVRYYPDADPGSGVLGNSTAQQLINVSNKCAVSTDGSLLVLSESGGTRGIGEVSNGLGVRTKNNCSTAQGRLDQSQSLTFTLGGSSALPEDVLIKSAEVDVEGKFDADLAFTAFFEGGSETGTIGLPNTSDNGPDSGVGDNNLVTIAPSNYFTAIALYPDGGQVSIEGGGDGTVSGGALRSALGTNATLFELVTVTEYDGIIACGETTDEVGDGTMTALATLTRGDDNVLGKAGGGECDVEIGYNLSSSVAGSVQTISFEFEEDELPSWFGSFTWAPETAVVPVPATQVDVDGDGPGGYADLEWCAGVSGGIPILPSGESWCMVEQQSVLLGGGMMQVTQEVYGLTDPNWAR
jgi:hypothetical protein